MDIKAEIDAGIVIISILDSKLDQSNIDEFFIQIDPILDNNLYVILDLSGISFIDSSGLSGFAYIHRRVREHKGRFCICCIGEDVQDAVDLLHIDRLVSLYTTREEALASFSDLETA